eukprot:jgi/Chlat1/2152/Chrsp17S00187
MAAAAADEGGEEDESGACAVGTPRAWRYRGEGAASVVLAYAGNDPDLVGKVLRLQKQRDKQSSNASAGDSVDALERAVWEKFPEVAISISRAARVHAYVRDVLLPLLGPSYVHPGEPVSVPRAWLCEKNAQLAEETASTGRVDESASGGLMLPDHTYFKRARMGGEEDGSVGAAPKCGFLADAETVSPGNRLLKSSVSRFEMHEQYKLARGEIALVSGYSPPDLFSGDPARIARAIAHLFHTPQRNLSIRTSSSSSSSSSFSLSSRTLYGALGASKQLTKGVEDKDDLQRLDAGLGDAGICPSLPGQRVEVLQRVVAEVLRREALLTRLLEAQRLDKYDIEGAIQVYKRLSGDDNCLITQQEHPVLASLTQEQSRAVLRDFLVAATAKDCSVMLALRPGKCVGTPDRSDAVRGDVRVVVDTASGHDFQYKIALVDLDIKPLRKMPYYYQLDQDILACYHSVKRAQS